MLDFNECTSSKTSCVPTKNDVNETKNFTKSYISKLQFNKGLEREAVENGDYDFSSVIRKKIGGADGKDDWVIVNKPKPEKFLWVESDKEYLERIEKLIEEREKQREREEKHTGKKTKVIIDDGDNIKHEMKEVDGGMRRNRRGHQEETQDSDSEDTIYNPVPISMPNRELFRILAPVGRAPTMPTPPAPEGRAPRTPPAPEGKAPNAPKFGKMEKKSQKKQESKKGRGCKRGGKLNRPPKKIELKTVDEITPAPAIQNEEETNEQKLQRFLDAFMENYDEDDIPRQVVDFMIFRINNMNVNDNAFSLIIKK